jgi:hypothetical protein
MLKKKISILLNSVPKAKKPNLIARSPEMIRLIILVD